MSHHLKWFDIGVETGMKGGREADGMGLEMQAAYSEGYALGRAILKARLRRIYQNQAKKDDKK